MDNKVTPVYEHNVILKEGFPCFVHYSENPQGMSPHYHPQIEIMYFYEAENVEFYCMNKTFHMNAGDMVLSNPFQIHACADFKKCAYLLHNYKFCRYARIQRYFASKRDTRYRSTQIFR